MVLIDKDLDKKLDLRARVFNLLGVTGAIIGLVIAAASAIAGAGVVNIALNLASSVAALGLIAYANRTGRFHLCCVITIIVVFTAFFTVMFFAAGGYHSGMPSFFIFALIFTVIMLEGAEMFLAASCEMGLYVGLCLYAYYRPESVSYFGSERGLAMDIITGFVASSLFLAIALLKILGAYRDASRELERKNAELELADRRKTEFLGNIAHELKTPIAVIMGIAQNARRQMSESRANASGKGMGSRSSASE